MQTGWNDAGVRSPGADSRPGWSGRRTSLPHILVAARRYVSDTFVREMDAGRGFLWLPVAFGSGILFYFLLPREPWLSALAGILLALSGLAFRARRTGRGYRLLLVLVAIAAGAAAGKTRTDIVAAPVIPHEMTATVTGWIAATEESASGGKRVRLRVATIERVRPADTPVNARITIRSKADSLHVGDAIQVLARLSPPSGPVYPGGYDFSFPLFYQQIGASGFAFGAAAPADIGQPPLGVRLRQPLASLRDLLRVRIEEALPGDYGHIAAALVMGDQRGIAPAIQDDMRASGLGHILSISGLHLALVAGSVFWLVRALLALSPALALNFPIKKWAAGVALAVATFYVGISGAEVATVRSWVMLAIMLFAIMIDRRALTLRNVALAALVILLFTPESLLSISFQMSFAATAALIAAYEAIAARNRRAVSLVDRSAYSFVDRARQTITTLFLTSLVAGLATAPFGAFYFQRVAPLTILANMAVAPAVAFIVMPMALVAVLAMPLGLESWPLAVMQWGLRWMVEVAAATTAWSEGIGGVTAPPPGAFLLMVGGFLWLVLWRERWRFAGMLPAAVAVLIALTAPAPDILVDEGATAVAVRGEDGRLRVMSGPRSGASFEIGMWLRADADPRESKAADLRDGVACDALGCTVHTADGAMVALTLRPEAFADDCRMAAIVVSRLKAPSGCAAATVIDRPRLDRFGAHAIYREEGEDARIRTAYPAVHRPFMPPVQTD